jgi:hypothetical protein
MDADVERFFEECRADPWFRERPEVHSRLEELFEKFYREGDESANWQDIWDRIREAVTRKESLRQRVQALDPILEEIIAMLKLMVRR